MPGLEITQAGIEYLDRAQHYMRMHVENGNFDAYQRVGRRVSILKSAQEGRDNIGPVLLPTLGLKGNIDPNVTYGPGGTRGVVHGRSKQLVWLKKKGFIR